MMLGTLDVLVRVLELLRPGCKATLCNLMSLLPLKCALALAHALILPNARATNAEEMAVWTDSGDSVWGGGSKANQSGGTAPPPP